jgi:HSP20 family protein
LLPAIKVHRQERRRGKFSRSLTLPSAVNIKSARATYQRGILEIRLAKLPGHQGEALTIDTPGCSKR